jgi:hypothetical protein
MTEIIRHCPDCGRDCHLEQHHCQLCGTALLIGAVPAVLEPVRSAPIRDRVA